MDDGANPHSALRLSLSDACRSLIGMAFWASGFFPFPLALPLSLNNCDVGLAEWKSIFFVFPCFDPAAFFRSLAFTSSSCALEPTDYGLGLGLRLLSFHVLFQLPNDEDPTHIDLPHGVRRKLL